MFAITRLTRKKDGGLLTLEIQVGDAWLDEETFTKGYEVVRALGGLTPWHIDHMTIVPGGEPKSWEKCHGSCRPASDQEENYEKPELGHETRLNKAGGRADVLTWPLCASRRRGGGGCHHRDRNDGNLALSG